MKTIIYCLSLSLVSTASIAVAGLSEVQTGSAQSLPFSAPAGVCEFYRGSGGYDLPSTTFTLETQNPFSSQANAKLTFKWYSTPAPCPSYEGASTLTETHDQFVTADFLAGPQPTCERLSANYISLTHLNEPNLIANFGWVHEAVLPLDQCTDQVSGTLAAATTTADSTPVSLRGTVVTCRGLRTMNTGVAIENMHLAEGLKSATCDNTPAQNADFEFSQNDSNGKDISWSCRGNGPSGTSSQGHWSCMPHGTGY